MDKKRGNNLISNIETYKKFFENEPAYCYIVSPDEVILDINQTALKTLGYKKQELIGKPLLKTIYSPSSQSKAKSLFLKWKKNGRIVNEEIKIKTKNGKELDVLLSVESIKDKNGKLLHSISVQEDITKFKTIQKYSLESDKKYASLINSIPIGLQENDLSGTITFSNKTQHKIFGYNEGELLGKKIWDLMINEKDKQGLKKYFSELCNKKPKPAPFFAKNKTKGGLIIDVIVNWDYIKDDKGKLIGFSSIISDITEKKKSEERLSYFQKALDSSSDAIGMSTPEGIHFYQNASFTKLFGYNKDELSGTRGAVKLYFDPKIGEDVFDNIMKGKNWEGEIEMVNKMGNKLNILLRAYPIKDDGGKVIGLVGLHTDISKKKKEEQMIKESELKYRQLHESIIDGFAATDLNGNITEVNKEFLKMTGYNENDIKNQSIVTLTPKKWIEMENKIINNQVLKRGYSDVYEKEYIRKDGSIFPIEIRSYMIKDDKGKPAGMWAIMRDITEKKKFEKSLIENEQKFKSLVHNVPGIVYRCKSDKDLTMIFISDQILKISGYPVSDFISKKRPYTSIIHHDDVKLVEDKVNEATKNKKPYTMEYRIFHKNSKIKWVHEEGQGIFDDAGRLLFLEGVILDITDKKKVEIELTKEKEFSQVILSTIPAGIDIVDQNGKIHFMNKFFSNIFGENSIGKKCWEVYKDDKTQCEECPLKKEIKINETKSLETRGVAGNKTFVITHTGIKLPNGNKAILEIFRDISNIKENEEKLKQRADELEKFNKLAVGRELKMVELKKKIKELEDQINQNLKPI